MMYSALLIAKYVVRRCDEFGRTISNLKLQKILYFIQAEFLVDVGRRCFPEIIEAWDSGPVVPEVYRKYKIYGSAHIPLGVADRVRPIAEEEINRINGIVDSCSQYSASQLTKITHHQSPWIEAYKRSDLNNEITPESIRNYFSESGI